MTDTVTGSFVVQCGSLETYNAKLANLAAYEADQTNPAVTNKVLDESNLTISYTITTSS